MPGNDLIEPVYWRGFGFHTFIPQLLKKSNVGWANAPLLGSASVIGLVFEFVTIAFLR
jgi:hypothetical protein